MAQIKVYFFSSIKHNSGTKEPQCVSGLTESDVWKQVARSMNEKKASEKVTTAKGKRVYTPFCHYVRFETVLVNKSETQRHIELGGSHGSMSPLCGYYDIVVILQMDFVLLLRSINDWTHESQCRPQSVNHRPRGKKASLNRASLSLRA